MPSFTKVRLAKVGFSAIGLFIPSPLSLGIPIYTSIFTRQRLTATDPDLADGLYHIRPDSPGDDPKSQRRSDDFCETYYEAHAVRALGGKIIWILPLENHIAGK